MMSQSNWLRTEARTVRPFKYLEDILSGVGFRLSESDEYSIEESLHKEEINLEEIMPDFILDFNASRISDELGIPAESVRLILSVEDKLLKKRALHTNMPASIAQGERIVMTHDFCRQFSWSGSMRFTLALVLADDRSAPLGEASRAGNWLARKEFVLSFGREASLFRIESVAPEFFQRFNLPEDTAYYVHILTEDFNQPFEDLAGLFTVYVNEAVSLMLFKTEDSRHGQALARSVYTDIAASILGTGFSHLTPDDDVEEGGLLHTAINRISKFTGIDTGTIVAMGREPGCCRLRALLQSETGLTKALVSVNTRN